MMVMMTMMIPPQWAGHTQADWIRADLWHIRSLFSLTCCINIPLIINVIVWARMEERGFQQPFYSFNQIGVLLTACRGGYSGKHICSLVGLVLSKLDVIKQFWWKSSFCYWPWIICWLLSVFLGAWYGLEAESTRKNGINVKIFCAFSLWLEIKNPPSSVLTIISTQNHR